jgi:hypothetical protein
MVPVIWMRVQMKKGGVWGAHAVFLIERMENSVKHRE